MKKQLPAFLSGMLTAALIGTLTVTALAVTSALTITVDPTIKIQVNGAEFHPKDANGKDVMTFAYEGTTYAPVRAMAEAFGLEVGYDKVTRMATVRETAAPETTPAPDAALPADYSKWTAEEEKAYQEFKGMWEIKVDGPLFITLILVDKIPKSQHTDYFANTEENLVKQFSKKLSTELYQTHSVDTSGNDATGSIGAYISYRYLETALWIDNCYQWVDSKTNEVNSQSHFYYNRTKVLEILGAT